MVQPAEYISESTLGDYGPLLPIGVLSPTGLAKEFAFKELVWEVEEEIDKLRNKKGGPGDHPGKTITTILAHVLTEWGGNKNFATAPEKARLQAIESAYMEDVLYAWVYFRYQEFDRYYTIRVPECDSCGQEYHWTADLENLKIQVCDQIPPEFEYKLSRKISHGDSNLDTLTIACPTWAAVSRVNQSARAKGLTQVKKSLILASVKHAKDSTLKDKVHAFSPSVRRRIRKTDLEKMMGVLEKGHFPQSDMRFEVSCSHCGHVFTTTLDWTWDFFFGSASLSSTVSP